MIAQSKYDIGVKVRIVHVDQWQSIDGFSVGDLAVIDDLDAPSTPDEDWIYVLRADDHGFGAWFSHNDLEVLK